MKLGELIELLEGLPSNMVAHEGFGEPTSYRGYYADVAFPPAKDVPVVMLLEYARSALGRRFRGYKGGDYLMDRETRCWLAPWGECSDVTIEPLAIGLAVQAELEACATLADNRLAAPGKS